MITRSVRLSCLALAAFFGFASVSRGDEVQGAPQHKLYWFIPDGLRADRRQFNVFEWAKAGELPNLKKMMERGCFGYSRPVFPGHTPANYATLMTGVSPLSHGVTDGTIRLLGRPLTSVAVGGYSSFAKLVPPIWVQLEKAGYSVSLQSVPGSTPPELSRGNTIRGRWGAWGIDLPAVIFQSEGLAGVEGPGFTRLVQVHGDEVSLSNWGYELKGQLHSASITLSHAGKRVAELTQGEWSDWIPVTLHIDGVDLDTFMKINAIRLGHIEKKGEVRIRILYDGLNDLSAQPSRLASEMRSKVGHMVDFVDNYPPQLVYFPEDKRTFLEEAAFSWDWHGKAVSYLIKNLKSDVVIHGIYTPNQQLTSRWWMPFVETGSLRYAEKNDAERAPLWDEVKGMYKRMDGMLGEIMNSTDPSWYVVLSSDHGVIPLYREVRLNNLFAKKGWLKFTVNSRTGKSEIDWKRTKVVFLQMNSVYINPAGLNGPYRRGAGKAYSKLRAEVTRLLDSLRDETSGLKAASQVLPHENATKVGLPEARVGDLIVANAPQFLFSEDLSEDKAIFVGSLKGGYKQGVQPEKVDGMLTPFVIMGPGVRSGCQLAEPIRHVDQFATIAHLMRIQAPYPIDGKVLDVLSK